MIHLFYESFTVHDKLFLYSSVGPRVKFEVKGQDQRRFHQRSTKIMSYAKPSEANLIILVYCHCEYLEPGSL